MVLWPGEVEGTSLAMPQAKASPVPAPEPMFRDGVSGAPDAMAPTLQYFMAPTVWLRVRRYGIGPMAYAADAHAPKAHEEKYLI